MNNVIQAVVAWLLFEILRIQMYCAGSLFILKWREKFSLAGWKTWIQPQTNPKKIARHPRHVIEIWEWIQIFTNSTFLKRSIKSLITLEVCWSRRGWGWVCVASVVSLDVLLCFNLLIDTYRPGFGRTNTYYALLSVLFLYAVLCLYSCVGVYCSYYASIVLYLQVGLGPSICRLLYG